MRKIVRHIIHCSDSTFGDVATIRRWHVARGWKDVGYHFVIKPDGEIEVGRMLDEIGAHCKGYNETSIGTCLIGVAAFTEAQFKSLRRLNGSLEAVFGVLDVRGHYELNKYKTCPNFNAREVLKCCK